MSVGIKVGGLGVLGLGLLAFVVCVNWLGVMAGDAPRAPAPVVSAHDLAPALQVEMAQTIRGAGYRCQELSYSRAWRQTERGDLWRVTCDGDLWAYRVLVTERGGVIVRPWGE